MRKSFLVFGAPLIGDNEINEINDTLRKGWLGTGPKTKQFEQEFAKYTGSKYAIGLNSCTAGLHLALDVLGIKKGDEVITSPMTFASTANVIEHVGAKPVFSDIEIDSQNIDPQKLEKIITKDTKAIIPVHMAGRPCKMDEIMEIASKHNIIVIEDAAHATEAKLNHKKIGSIAHMACFSFYVTKNLVTGEGGMLTTDNAEWADEIRIRSLHGISKDAWKRYSNEGFSPYETLYPGYKYNMTDMQASLGIHQLAKLDQSLKVRKKLWYKYNQAFKDCSAIKIPTEENHIQHARHLYTILIRLSKLSINRNQFIDELKKRNIGSGIHFTALHLHKFYKEKYNYKIGNYPNAEWISNRTISLPLSAALDSQDIEDVLEAVLDIIELNQK